jgi:MFS family permease
MAAAIGGIIAVLGELRDEFGFSNTEVGVIVAAGFLAAFVAQIGLAQFADRGHARVMATAGLLLSAGALGIMVFVDGLSMWIAARAALGFGGGLAFPGLRRAATVLDPQRVGENLGRLVVGEVVGFMFGPVVAGVLVKLGGIRLPFVVFAIALGALAPMALRLPPDAGRLDTSTRRTAFDLLRGQRLQAALMFVGGYFMLIGAFEAVLPVMFADRGASSLTTGIAFMLMAVPVVFISTAAGRIADRHGPPRVATIGITVVALVTMSYGFLPGIVIPVCVMTVVGAADGFGFLAGQVMVSRAVEEERQAGALGLMGAVEVLGAGVAAIPAALLYDHAGVEVVWLTMGTTTLAILGLARLRLRGTSPVSTAVFADTAVAIEPHAPLPR